MKRTVLVILGIVGAVLLHLAFITFGGVLFLRDELDHGRIQDVTLLPEEIEKEKDEKPQEADEEAIEAETEEPPPDAEEIIRSLEIAPVLDAPALDAASLGAIEAALGGGGGGEFAEAMSFASGGRIGGQGRPGGIDEKLERAFSLAEIDQKPRPIFQAAPAYPASLRSKKIEGVVSVRFIVEASGKVASPRVEKSTDPAFERPALEAVKQWKFEPAIKGGKRVACQMRVPIRFQPS